ncbi:S66 peptidase family protein [Candidatus Cetobacterium colombiensis]|uniref:LD-carboxypeptidase n=1 Tax=Candidatus Cetobacterium colombiensis TaxID=3073100 RepID=A0ABU4W7X4_9FUSO|nr:LD-carboxypeptidase [Candidatus Cetobacterium colombiensis]MDX8335623.1 LD-carboxypeptidase [Candidatus Cetobacterium colombiensis]
MRKLKKGDTIGLVAPANCVDKEKLQSAVENLEKLGYKIKLGKSVENEWYSFAGKDEERAKDINDFFKDTTVDGIMCVRGGYGGIRILSMLDYETIKNNKKPFIGYSDITSLHMAFLTKCQLKTFHGPMAVSNFSGDYNLKTLEDFFKVMDTEKDYFIDNFQEELYFYNNLKVTGELVGGNLAVLISNIGTEYDLDYNNKILFLEDIGESTYKIDRMLWHLKNAGIFDKVAGIILGDFANCEKSSENDLPLKEVFNIHFKDMKKPVCYNLKSGHCTPMLTLEFGKVIEIDGKKKTLLVKK